MVKAIVQWIFRAVALTVITLVMGVVGLACFLCMLGSAFGQ